jgi:CMP-N-acetylneuraminic acid synthetase
VAQKEYRKKIFIIYAGHPLLSYSLQAAKESRFINKIIVSTDSLGNS